MTGCCNTAGHMQAEPLYDAAVTVCSISRIRMKEPGCNTLGKVLHQDSEQSRELQRDDREA